LNSLFCRHNRFTADCPICSKGTLLDSSRVPVRPRPQRPAGAGGARSRSASEPSSRGARVVTGPYVSAGPYEREAGGRYEVRLERVPGGLRLACWSGGAIERFAPVIAAPDLRRLVAAARERAILAERDVEPLERALASSPAGEPLDAGVSVGRSGDMREELRVEAGEGGMLRVARWLYRPNQGWELQEAPVMLPAKRFAEAIRNAVRGGVVERAPAADGSAAAEPRAGSADGS
jgi:hypothetical protein